MTESAFTHPLVLIRHRCGWSQQDLADLIAKQTTQMPYVDTMAARREKVWRWEHWGVVPDHNTQLALAALLDVSVDVVEDQPWPLWLPVTDRRCAFLVSSRERVS